MKKNQGFTLIELLAVVVILAVIALISVPLIMNVIDGARKGALQNTAYGIAEAGKYAFTNEVIKDGSAIFTAYTYVNGVETSSPTGKSLNYKGERPQKGTILINSKGDIAMSVYNGKYCAEKGFDDVEVTVSEKVEADCVLVEALTEVEVLIVAGGGGGGNDYGGGGGAGGVIYNSSYLVTPGTSYPVTIGAGGAGAPTVRSALAGGTSGQNSIFATLTANGGGGGGGSNSTGANGKSGGSGGGGSGLLSPGALGGAGTSGQGNNGGTGGTTPDYQGGGGGGAGQTGTNGTSPSTNAKGGDGLQFSISGTSKYYGGGGGAGSGLPAASVLYGEGGLGGGGRGATHTLPAELGQPNTGGGGGGANRYEASSGHAASSIGPGGSGGSGVVIVRYFGPQRANGGAITTVDGYTIHTFTSGTATFTPSDL